MNRVPFNIVEQGTNVPIKQLIRLHSPQPHQTAFVSQSFPLYPLTITVYLENPPINKFSICFLPNFAPNKATLLGSEDNLFFVKFHQIKDLPQRQQECTIVFKQKLFFTYVRLVLEQPLKNKANLCNQIKIRGFEFSMVTFFQTRFVCSLSAKLSYHPTLFRILQILQYKSLLLKQNKNKLHQKYDRRIQEILTQISQKGFDKQFPEKTNLQKWNQQIYLIQIEPIFQQVYVDQPDPVQLKRDVFKLQKQLKAFEIDRFSNIKPEVLHYFQKYHNIDIKQGYLRQLSSNQSQDHNRALINFWNEAKQLEKIPAQLEEAIIMFFNYFLQFIDSPLKVAALKIMILFDKKNTNTLNHNLNHIYDRVLFNAFKYFHQTQDNELRQLSLRYCYTLYQRISNQTFLKQLLNAYKSYPVTQQVQILQILERLTFKGVTVTKKQQIVNFLIDLLMHNQLNLTEKNRAYNVAAYLASVFGKPAIMKDFQKLNSMILMTMQKNIDRKLSKIRVVDPLTIQQTNSCQYCGYQSKTFRDENLYDLHKAKQCKFFSNCNYCQQNIEIPQLFKHYIEHCTNKHSFKHCDNCFEVIQIKQEEKHNEKCPHKLLTRCPLCYEKVDNKLRLKEHIMNGCPNNPR